MPYPLHVQPRCIQGGETTAGGRLQHGNAFCGLWAGQRRCHCSERDAITHHLLDLGFFLQLPPLQGLLLQLALGR